MREWYYAVARQQRGPVAEPELVKMFESGQLAPGTLVWTAGLQKWTAARDVDGLIPSANKPPDLPQSTHYPALNMPAREAPSGEQIRPWVRYWARMIDMILFGIIFVFGIMFINEPVLETHETLLNIVLFFVYVFVEPLILSVWGTTPGKALFKVYLRNNDGSRLSYAEAQSRAFKVWYRGLGLAIPIVLLITQICAYRRLTKQGITSWDEDGDFKVSHQIIGTGRTLVIIGIMLGMFILMVIGTFVQEGLLSP